MSINFEQDNINIGSNVISLESFEDVNENYFLKAPKKGKLFKGSNWTAYKKENLGTIPRKIENVLVENKNNKTKKGFNSQTQKLQENNQCVKYNYPGPGSYQISKNFDFMSTGSSFYSSKGYGNGFISTSERFNELQFHVEKYKPGPGEYKVEDTASLNQSINKSIFNKSLYKETSVKSLKVRQNTPGPGFYNPILLKHNDLSGVLSSFKSGSERFKRDQKSAYPGPGKYFKENNMNTTETNKKNNTLSYFFRCPSPKKENLVDKYIEPHKNEELQFQLRQNLNNGRIFIDNVFFPDNNTNDKMLKTAENFNLEIESMRGTKKENFSILSKKAVLTAMNKSNKIRSNSAVNNISKHALVNQKIKKKEYPYDNQEELKYIQEILGRNAKKPLFELSPPRWKKFDSNHVPGPAFYDPVVIPSKKSFNKNPSVWIN
jgi:hypothetical protein